jgi:protocatechuate 3,4-dioxygenase alpha subunit
MSWTPSQTIGPFFHVALPCPAPGRFGDRDGVTLSGCVIDGDSAPVGDALVEMWDGRDLARCSTDADGAFRFVVPVEEIAAATPGDEAPHLAVSVHARGVLCRLATRCYLPTTPDRVPNDAVLAAAGSRASTMCAVADGDALRFDIHLQGEQETVFLVF